MGTRSNIGVQNQDAVEFIYCHWDGYPSHHGPLLRDHYQEEAKVRKLIALGDISQLAKRVDPVGPHSYADKEDGTTVAYGRDRGEKNVDTRTTEHRDAIRQEVYAYLFVPDGSGGGEWMGARMGGSWAPLAELIEGDE